MNHPYHLVDLSPWPLTSSLGGLFTLSGFVCYLYRFDNVLFFLGLLLLGFSVTLWFRDICRESSWQGKHTKNVVDGLRYGMILFILSEGCLFFSFFWAFFHCSLSPVLGWPVIHSVDPLGIPLLNTLLLLSSGCTITWAHMSLLCSEYYDTVYGLCITVALGLVFLLVQLLEYNMCPFTAADSVYGSVFFVATGFHGIHVLMGAVFISVGLLRLHNISRLHHFGFEASAWYWHFVDVVWLLLFICIYCWGE